MAVVKMKKPSSRTRKKNDDERQKDFNGFMDSAIHMEHTGGEFIEHVEESGLDFLASEWKKFRTAQFQLATAYRRVCQEKVGSKWSEDVTPSHFYDD